MKPGRELDALVAEKVINMPLKERCYCDFDNPGWEGQDKCPRCNWQYPDKETKGWIIKQPPHYSTDIAAAWEVVKKFKCETENGSPLEFCLYNFYGGIVRAGWAYIVRSETDFYYSADANTAPHAICLAALKAVAPDTVSED